MEQDEIADDYLEGLGEVMELEELLKIKSEANLLYKKGIMFKGHTLGRDSFTEATIKYYTILKSLSAKEQPEDEDETGDSLNIEESNLKKSVLLNMAACSLQLESIDSCLNCCETVLEMDENNEKALFRKGEALMLDNRNIEAEACFVKCVHSNPRNQAAREKVRQLRRQLKQEAARTLAESTFVPEPSEKIESSRDPVDPAEIWKISEDFLVRNDLEKSGTNGDIIVDETENVSYIWSQSVKEVSVLILFKCLECDTAFSNLEVVTGRWFIKISLPEKDILLERRFDRPVRHDDTVWQIERDVPTSVPYFSFSFQKDNSNFGPNLEKNEWWSCIFENDPQINTSACRIADEKLSELSDDIKQEWSRNVQDAVESGEINERIQKESEMNKYKNDAEAEKRARDNHNERARKDPKKKALLEMLEKSFPDLPVEIK